MSHSPKRNDNQDSPTGNDSNNRNHSPSGNDNNDSPDTRGACWFFNNGGCRKSAQDCSHEHTDSPDLKGANCPNWLRKPCRYHHLHNNCRFGRNCNFRHGVLNDTEWSRWFSGKQRQARLAPVISQLPPAPVRPVQQWPLTPQQLMQMQYFALMSGQRPAQ